jgi:hypothetical protein
MERNLKKPPPKPTKKREPRTRELAAWIGRTAPRQIGEREWETLLAALAPVSESYLRRLVREWARDSGIPLAPLVDGVRQESFDALESSLLRLLAEYEKGDAPGRARVRRVVIAAKDHARFASHKFASGKEEARAEKEEMILWMLTWLENPPVFPEWVRLRRAALAARGD